MLFLAVYRVFKNMEPLSLQSYEHTIDRVGVGGFALSASISLFFFSPLTSHSLTLTRRPRKHFKAFFCLSSSTNGLHVDSSKCFH